MENVRCLQPKKRLQIRYDRRTFKFFPESGYVSLNTVVGRLNFPIRMYEYAKRYLHGQFTGAQRVVGKNGIFLNVQCKLPDISQTFRKSVLGMDRGIMNIITCSDNSFVSSRHLRAIKGRYQYLKAKLHTVVTASAKRKFRKLSGAERRFTLDVNHIIAKRLVQKPYDVFAVEALRISKHKTNGRRFNKMLGYGATDNC